MTEPADNDMLIERALEFCHAKYLGKLSERQLIGGPYKNNPKKDANRRDDKGINQARPCGDRHNVPIADCGHRDHREIDHIGK